VGWHFEEKLVFLKPSVTLVLALRILAPSFFLARGILKAGAEQLPIMKTNEKQFESKEVFADWFKKRTKNFAVDVIKFCKSIEQNPASRVISYQIIKSSTSVAANYRAACRARSNKEFYSKLCIVVEEADESVYWLELTN